MWAPGVNPAFPESLRFLQPGGGHSPALETPRCPLTGLSSTTHPRCPRACSTARETEARAGTRPRSPHGMTCTWENTKNWENTPKRGEVGLLLKKSKCFNIPRGPSKAQVNQEKPLWSWKTGDGVISEPQTPTPHPQPHQRLQGAVPTELPRGWLCFNRAPSPCPAVLFLFLNLALHRESFTASAGEAWLRFQGIFCLTCIKV